VVGGSTINSLCQLLLFSPVFTFCLHIRLLANWKFTSSLQTDPDFDLDIRDDVQDECSKFGVVKHIFVDK
jgi:hypothetical protein